MKKIIVLLALSLLAACSPKKSEVRAAVGTGTSATISGVTTGSCSGNASTSAVDGNIFDNQNSFNFENQVKALLSASTSSYDLGIINSSVSPGTGVTFAGLVKLDASGVVLGAQSKVVITIKDSIWANNKIDGNLITLKFDSATTATAKPTISGQFNPTSGDGYLSLKDSFGEVRFEGRIDAQNFSGTVKFQNTANVMGGQPASGTLGQFSIQRCAILK
jgi:hypothetical protein